MDCLAFRAEHDITNYVIAANSETWRAVGEVVAMRMRGVTGGPREVGQLVAVEGMGLYGDKHANPLSPRQLLLAGTDVYQDLALNPMTLRENLLVNFSTEGLESSSLLKVGSDAVLWLTFQCEACGHLEQRHTGIVRSIGRRRGMLARVLRGGVILPGDAVSCAPSRIARISDRWQDRIAGVLQQVPPGKRVEFRQLAQLAGVPKAYCRVFPKILSQLPTSVACKAQAGSVADIGQRWTGSELFDLSTSAGGTALLNH
jgi:hypothetical protein